MILGIGIDLVEIERIAAIPARRGERFLERLFTPAEQRFCLARARPAPGLAARFAAKEAAMKALGTGWQRGVGFRSIEVLREPHEAPRLVLHGAAEACARRLGVERLHLSLSHSESAAIAQVILEGEPPHGD